MDLWISPFDLSNIPCDIQDMHKEPIHLAYSVHFNMAIIRHSRFFARLARLKATNSRENLPSSSWIGIPHFQDVPPRPPPDFKKAPDRLSTYQSGRLFPFSIFIAYIMNNLASLLLCHSIVFRSIYHRCQTESHYPKENNISPHSLHPPNEIEINSVSATG